MSRLPIPGKDSGSWGHLLNEFLLTAHNTDGSHIVDTDSAFAANSDSRIASQKAVKTYIDNQVAGGSTPDATDIQKGKMRLAGDLSGDANTPIVKSRTASTVGLLHSDHRYDSTMSPVHYADAVNAALASNQNGEVFLRGEVINFSQAAGKVITPTSYIHIRGAGAGKTVLRTARTDYIVKNSNTSVTRAGLSDLTIDCQNIAIVSGIDIRKFSYYYLARAKFQNSSQWFARFGNEPSASTTEISSNLVIEDCEFSTHDGIYEMLLVYNTDFADINRCVFANKTGSAGAAPTLGIWQKANHITIRNSIFTSLVSSAIYYAYSTHHIAVENCHFINTGQALRGANVSDNGKFGEKYIHDLSVRNCRMLGGANSVSTDAIQIGSVVGFLISNSFISNYSKGIRIGFGNTTPSAGGDGGAAHFQSRYGTIENVTFENINSGGNTATLNSPLYFTNGGDFGQLIIRDCIVSDPSHYLDYAVIFNGGSTASASVAGGAVTGITVTNTFAWYATAPTVTISGNGSGATAVATIDSDGHLTGVQVTNGGSGYSTATVSIAGAHYKNITFINCDFGGRKILVNDNAQIDYDTVRFINCRNFDTSNWATANLDKSVMNNTSIVQHDGLLALGASTIPAFTSFYIAGASSTFQHNNVRHTNSNDNLQHIMANFAGKKEVWYKNNTNASNKRMEMDVDTGILLANGFDANIGTDLTTGGLVAKRLTTAQRDSLASPGNGTIIYNSTTNKLQTYENGAWANLI